MPPSAPLVAYLLTSRHPFITPLLLAVTAALLSHLAACFAQLVKDRMLLSAEVMREYDQRFVYKRVFAPMVDRGVGTSDCACGVTESVLFADLQPSCCPNGRRQHHKRHPIPHSSTRRSISQCPFSTS